MLFLLSTVISVFLITFCWVWFFDKLAKNRGKQNVDI